MGRIISFRNLIGLLLIAAGIVCVFFVEKATYPASVTVVVASQDLHAGDQITPDKVHKEDWMQVDPLSVSNMVTLDQWQDIAGGRVAFGQQIPAGHPISVSQIVFDDKLNNAVDRVTLLAAPGKVVLPIDMQPGQVGNWIRTGDYVDLIFSVGQVPNESVTVPPVAPAANSLQAPGATPQPALPISAVPAQSTPNALQLPLATVPLLNVHVLRVDRQQKQVYGQNSQGVQSTKNVDGDVTRIYVELDPQDATIVGFLLQSGKVIASSHLDKLNNPNQTVGLSWTDFVNWFLGHRPDLWGKTGTISAGSSAAAVPTAVSVPPTNTPSK